MTRAWWWIGVGCRTVIVLFVVAVCFVLCFPPFGPVGIEFVDLSGEQAELRLSAYWSENADLKRFEKASGKIWSEIDGHVGWFRITIGEESAEKWQDAAHKKLEQSARLSSNDDFLEGVHRTATDPMLPEAPRVKAPQWWVPPPVEFRVTETMKWTSGGAKYATALYSTFDPTTSTLWIYDYGRQHGKLWPRGAAPAGEHFIVDKAKRHEGPQRDIQPADPERL